MAQSMGTQCTGQPRGKAHGQRLAKAEEHQGTCRLRLQRNITSHLTILSPPDLPLWPQRWSVGKGEQSVIGTRRDVDLVAATANTFQMDKPANQSRPRGIIIVALLMIVFGLAELTTSFTHRFFGLSTAQVATSTYLGATIGTLRSEERRVGKEC